MKNTGEKKEEQVETISTTERNWAVICHLGVLMGILIPFVNFVLPLIILYLRKNDSEFVTFNARESLVFQCSIIIYVFLLIVFLLIFIIPEHLQIIFYSIFMFLIAFNVIMVLKASLSAYQKKRFSYPLKIGLIKEIVIKLVENK